MVSQFDTACSSEECKHYYHDLAPLAQSFIANYGVLDNVTDKKSTHGRTEDFTKHCI
jgi:hypothetical protein